MGFSIAEMLSGDIVKPRVAPQDDSSRALGSMLAFLSQGQNQQAPTLPQQPNYAELYRVTPQERAAKQEAEQHAAAVEQMKALVGDPGSPGNGVPTPYRDAQLPTKGSGLLGGGSLQEFAAKLATSQDPAYASAGLGMIAAKPPTPSVHSMGAPGKPGYKVNFVLGPNNTAIPVGEPYKENSGTNIFTGDGMQMRPATSEEKSAWGIPSNVPATTNNKTGEVVAHPTTTTEAQTKAFTHYTGLNKAMESLDRLMSTRDMSPVSSTGNAQDYLGSLLSDTNIPVIKTLGKTLQSDNMQLFSQAQQAAKINIIHALTGAAYTAQEAEDKSDAYLPQWGESKVSVQAKKDALAAELEAIGSSTGRPELQIPSSPPGVTFVRSKVLNNKTYYQDAEGKWYE